MAEPPSATLRGSGGSVLPLARPGSGSRKSKSVSFHSATSLPTERKISSGKKHYHVTTFINPPAQGGNITRRADKHQHCGEVAIWLRKSTWRLFVCYMGTPHYNTCDIPSVDFLHSKVTYSLVVTGARKPKAQLSSNHVDLPSVYIHSMFPKPCVEISVFSQCSVCMTVFCFHFN